MNHLNAANTPSRRLLPDNPSAYNSLVWDAAQNKYVPGNISTPNSVLKLPGSSTLSATLQQIQDGSANNTGIYISTSGLAYSKDNFIIGDTAIISAAHRFAVKGQGNTAATKTAVFVSNNGTVLMCLDDSGGLGIGTATPDSGYRLHIKDKTIFEPSAGKKIYLDYTGSNIRLGSNQSEDWLLSYAGSEVARIKSGELLATVLATSNDVIFRGAGAQMNCQASVNKYLRFSNWTGFSFGDAAVPTAPDGKALLDLQSTGKGVLLPRMTQAQRTSIATPPQGLLVYQTDGAEGYYQYKTVGGWTAL